MTTTAATPAPADRTGTAVRSGLARLRPRRNPWRHPWFLEGFTWLYLLWSLVPVGIAVLFSFNDGQSQSVWQGFSWRWYFADPVNSVLHDPNLHAAVIQTVRLAVYATVITVPLGVAFALGINRWRSYTAATFNFVLILSFVIPELIFGVAMFFVFTVLFTHGGARDDRGDPGPRHLESELARHHRPGQAGDHREAVRGGSRRPRRQLLMQTMRRVMLPLLTPAIFASAVLVFSSVIDDFVLVDLLNSNSGNTPMSVYIYSQQHGGNGGPRSTRSAPSCWSCRSSS